MSLADLNTRLEIVEHKLDRMHCFIGGVFSSSYQDEIRLLLKRVDQLESSFKQSIAIARKESEDGLKKNIIECDPEIEQDVHDTVQERKKMLAWNLFSADITDELTKFKVRDENIKEVSADYLDGLALLVRNYKNVSLEKCFEDCSQLATLEFPLGFNRSSITDMRHMFRGCQSLTSLNLSTFNTSSVTNMSYMFMGCSSLTSLDLFSFNTGKVTGMCYMFGGCDSLISLDLSTFDTGKVTNMCFIFAGCSGLASLDLSTFNTDNVTDMSHMFSGCNSLTTLDLLTFDTSNVVTMKGMFQSCESLTSLNLSTFSAVSVVDVEDMFEGCSSLTTLNLSRFITCKFTCMDSMFDECESLKKVTTSDSRIKSILPDEVIIQTSASSSLSSSTDTDSEMIDLLISAES